MLVNRVPTLLNPSQVGVKFIDVMGVCHWSLLTQETLDIGMRRPSNTERSSFSKTRYGQEDVAVLGAVLRHMHDQSKL